MTEMAKLAEDAICLMKRALVLLDASDEGLAAAHLQHAIDTAEKKPIASLAHDEAEFASSLDSLTKKR